MSAKTLDVSSVLIAPTSPGLIEQAIEHVKGQSAAGLGTISKVIGFIVRFDPLQEWVYRPFIGDWRAMERAAVAWPRCGQAIELVNQRIGGLGDDVKSGWQGRAAEQYGRSQAETGRLLDTLPAQCNKAGEMLQHLVKAARGILNFVNQAISNIVSMGLQMVAALAIPVVGLVKVGALVAQAVPRAIKMAIEFTNMINEFVGYANAALELSTGIANLLGDVRKKLAQLSAVSSTALEVYTFTKGLLV